MTLKTSDLRITQAPEPYRTALAETFDTAEAALIIINEWVEAKRLPSYDPDLHIALTRLAIDRATEIRGTEQLGSIREWVGSTKR
jgi:hypothetical protein